MNYKIIALLLSVTIIGCTNQNTKNSEITTNKQMERASFELTSAMRSTVYTTANETDLRLTETGTLKFEAAKQATEGEISIFINPKKSFQTFLGIGGAITDASAEIFAQLPEDKQTEFLTAYYDKEKGKEDKEPFKTKPPNKEFDEEMPFKVVDYERINIISVGVIQDLIKQNEKQQEQIERLEKKINLILALDNDK